MIREFDKETIDKGVESVVVQFPSYIRSERGLSTVPEAELCANYSNGHVMAFASVRL